MVDVLSTDAAQIQPRAPMRLVEWGGEGALAGRVRRVEPSGFTKISALGVEEGRARLRTIRLGHRGASEPEVVAGLTAGEEVILYPSDRIAEGARVRLR